MTTFSIPLTKMNFLDLVTTNLNEKMQQTEFKPTRCTNNETHIYCNETTSDIGFKTKADQWNWFLIITRGKKVRKRGERNPIAPIQKSHFTVDVHMNMIKPKIMRDIKALPKRFASDDVDVQFGCISQMKSKVIDCASQFLFDFQEKDDPPTKKELILDTDALAQQIVQTIHKTKENGEKFKALYTVP